MSIGMRSGMIDGGCGGGSNMLDSARGDASNIQTAAAMTSEVQTCASQKKVKNRQ
jgi:hypothetical protein